ncbi:CDK5 regulatory subunit-associated protein 3-like isoform X3 [Oscarella lobularis]|uniref:CDK5 regulatory subunit-associated protein 3-like isoform X3 n=1 Tax=Oscarella lobularis TaxID=121494 RepID=UPI003313B0FE
METTSEGFDPESLPIDIHYNKLLDWLIDRKHCTTGWQSKAYAVREKISAAVQDMPPVEEMTLLLRGSYINYFHCLRIVDLLKVSEADTKNFFGQYSSKRMKDWKEVLRLYEKDSMFLAESASMLARNVNYEIPATKRQIGRCQQIQRECSRKESECAANAVQLRKKFSALCKELKIEGNDVKRELKKLVDELPSVYESVCCGIKELEQCVKYYEEFVLFIAPSASESEILLMIKFIQSHGNATVYQWKTGKIPDKVLAPVIQATMEEEEQSGNISWGDSEAIDFGDADINCADIAKEIEVAGGVDLDVGGIDFGDDEQEAQGEIDWGNGEIQVESAGSREDDGILVTGDDAESVIAYTQTRGHLVDELLELETFFSQRLKELDEEPSIVSTNLFQSASELLQLQTADSISGMRSKVAAVLQTLTSSRMQHLFMIKNSQTYIDRLADSLTHKLTLANKMETALQAAKDRAAAAAREQADLEPKLEAMRQKTKELQKQLEQSLSKRYNNRIVNIMGEINSI